MTGESQTVINSRPKNDFSAAFHEKANTLEKLRTLLEKFRTPQHHLPRASDVAAADQTLGECILVLRGPCTRVRHRGGVVEPRLHRGWRARDLQHRQRQRSFNAGQYQIGTGITR